MYKSIYLLLPVFFLSGCTVGPTVQYRTINSSKDMDGITDSYFRQRSVIELKASKAAGKDGEGNDIVETQVSIVSKPKEYRAAKLGVHAEKNWRSNTVVNINKIPNTDMVNSIGTEVTDTTAKTISDYGGGIVKAISLVGALGAAPKPTPCLTEKDGTKTITLPDTLPSGPEKPLAFDGNGKGCITVKLSPLPPDAIPASNIPLNADTHNYYYSACRDAEVTVNQGLEHPIVKTVRISDPLYVQLVKFPPKGVITSHSECGVSVQTEKGATDSTSAIIDALATQGKAIADAVAAAKKDDTAAKK